MEATTTRHAAAWLGCSAGVVVDRFVLTEEAAGGVQVGDKASSVDDAAISVDHISQLVLTEDAAALVWRSRAHE